MLKRAIVAVWVAALLPMTTGLAMGSPRTASPRATALGKAGTATIKAGASGMMKFSPARLNVAVGTKVIWKNVSGTITHTVNAYGGNWTKATKLPPGASTSFVFKKKGKFHYRCKIHSSLVGGTCTGMCGVVIVG